MTDEEFESLKTRLDCNAAYYGNFNVGPKVTINCSKPGKWKCYLFGSRAKTDGWAMTYIPIEGHAPNWFWRKMQYLCFGNRWVKEK
jgi:hypothetical protein